MKTFQQCEVSARRDPCFEELLLGRVSQCVWQTGAEFLHEGCQLLYVAEAGGELLVHGRVVLVAHVQPHLLVHPERPTSKHCQIPENKIIKGHS